MGDHFHFRTGPWPERDASGEAAKVMARKIQPTAAPQPIGEVLKTHVLAYSTQDALAKAMGVSRLTINQLVNGKRSMTAEMALRLSRVTSTTPHFWLNLQMDIDLARASFELKDILPKLEALNLRKASA